MKGLRESQKFLLLPLKKNKDSDDPHGYSFKLPEKGDMIDDTPKLPIHNLKKNLEIRSLTTVCRLYQNLHAPFELPTVLLLTGNSNSGKSQVNIVPYIYILLFFCFFSSHNIVFTP